MLLQLILALTALAVNALVMPPNISTTSIQSLHKRTPLPPHVQGLHIPVTDNELNTYSASDMAIFLKAHNQALDMCAKVIDEATKKTRRFDRIFRRWFAEEDRQKVVDVFKDMAGADSGMLGHPKFDDFLVINDIKDKEAPNGYCNREPDDVVGPFQAYHAFAEGSVQSDAFILCPIFFTLRDLPKKGGTSCQTIGDNLVEDMFTKASCLVHEYTHFDQITHQALGVHVEDHAYGVEDMSKLDKAKALTNADSYAWFATELVWSVKCKRKFVLPSLDTHAPDPPHAPDSPHAPDPQHAPDAPHDQNPHTPNPDQEGNVSTPPKNARRASVRVSPKQRDSTRPKRT